MVLNRPVELDIRHSAVYLVARIDMHADIWHGFTSHPHTRTHTHAIDARVFIVARIRHRARHRVRYYLKKLRHRAQQCRTERRKEDFERTITFTSTSSVNCAVCAIVS